jgi:hypothetical protein
VAGVTLFEDGLEFACIASGDASAEESGGAIGATEEDTELGGPAEESAEGS